MVEYAKVIVMGSPISKSNFKLWNKNGRAILPNNSGKYHDRYSNYEDEISLNARNQNPGVTMDTSLIAVLKVYYKSDKRHPDTNNITKSIFDGIEKSGLIVNDAQIRRLIIEEYYDKVNPRFELELFAEAAFRMSYTIKRHGEDIPVIYYEPPSNKKNPYANVDSSTEKIKPEPSSFTPKSKSEITPFDEKVKSAEDKLKKIESQKNNESQESTERIAGKEKIDNKTDRSKAVQKVENTSVLYCSECKKEIKTNDYVKANGGKTVICRKCFGKLF